MINLQPHQVPVNLQVKMDKVPVAAAAQILMDRSSSAPAVVLQTMKIVKVQQNQAVVAVVSTFQELQIHRQELETLQQLRSQPINLLERPGMLIYLNLLFKII